MIMSKHYSNQGRENHNEIFGIRIKDCQHGFLYKIEARNFRLGVYNEKVQGFTGIRCKFGDEFLDTEYHYDTGAPHGTATPKKLLMECPIKDLEEYHRVDDKTIKTNKDLFNWLQSIEEKFPYDGETT